MRDYIVPHNNFGLIFKDSEDVVTESTSTGVSPFKLLWWALKNIIVKWSA